LTDLFNAQDSKEPPDLPDEIELHDPELAWRLWTTLDAIDWRWPPDVILRQPEWIMDDILTVANLAGRVRKLRGG
jgi:hypothetical protein